MENIESAQMRRPNLFIVGGPKCGTTSFQEYLRGHSQIFMSDPKEPCFFDSDLPFPNSPHNESEYLRCFQGVTDRHVIIGEASSNYLFSKVAAEKILRFNPDARFIVMLRNPIDMAESLHGEAVKTLVEDEVDFRTAWHLQDERRQGSSLPRVSYQREFVLYGDFCKLGEQLHRLYGTVPRERVHVIFFDDLCRNPREVYRTALKFLGVPDDGRTEFPIRNARASARSSVVRWVLTQLLVLRNRVPLPMHFGLISGALKLNLKESQRRPLDPEFRKQLVTYFKSDVELLSVLTGRDLSCWLLEPNLRDGAETHGRRATVVVQLERSDR